MKKLILTASMTALLTTTTTVNAQSPTEDLVELADLWASATIDGYDLGRRVLDILLFGSSGQDYVRLHQDSLDEIDLIVQNALLDTEIRDMQSKSRGFRHSVENYHAAHINGSGSQSEIGRLADDGMTLIEHAAYYPSSENKSHLLTASFASDGTLVASVYGEAVAIGRFPAGHGAAQTAFIASRLNTLGLSTSQYVNSNVNVSDAPFHCSGMEVQSVPDSLVEDTYSQQNMDRSCVFTVNDALTGKAATFAVWELGYAGAAEWAYNQRAEWVIANQNSIRGSKYESLLNKLNIIATN